MKTRPSAVEEIRKMRYEAIIRHYAKPVPQNGKVECAICGRRTKLRGFIYHVRKEHRYAYDKASKEAVISLLKKRKYLPAWVVWHFWPADEKPPFVYVNGKKCRFFFFNGGDGDKSDREQEKAEGDLL